MQMRAVEVNVDKCYRTTVCQSRRLWQWGFPTIALLDCIGWFYLFFVAAKFVYMHVLVWAWISGSTFLFVLWRNRLALNWWSCKGNLFSTELVGGKVCFSSCERKRGNRKLPRLMDVIYKLKANNFMSQWRWVAIWGLIMLAGRLV